jgi:hypothetical protein
MDWKRFYAAELAAPRGRDAVGVALARQRGGDPRLGAALRAGGVVSFPHVTVRDSGDSIATVVETLLAACTGRVVALGVLHGSVLPAPFNAWHASLRDDTPAGVEAFARLRGAFVDTSAVVTPFGPIPETRSPTIDALLHDDPSVLRHEFSLDLFLAFLAASARVHGVRPPEVLRLYVSAVRDPAGGFATAASLAISIDTLLDDDTVCVATGDVAHLGHGYGPDPETARLPSDEADLTTMLAASLRDMHDAGLARHDFATAWEIGTRLRSDQRQILPVIAELLGCGARCEPLAFRLSDYAAINDQPRPCFVAAALNLFRPADREEDINRRNRSFIRAGPRSPSTEPPTAPAPPA